jgi:group I intron endonuclease
MSLNCGIYKLVNVITGKFYLGQSSNLYQRRHTHFSALKYNRHFNKHLQSSYNKYGVENFRFEIILYCEEFELDRYELFFVTKWKSNLYNILTEHVVSRRGCKASEETRKRISDGHKGIKRFGHRPSAETLKKMSECRKGKHPTEEARQHMREAQKGRKMSDSTRAILLKSNINRVVSDETRNKMSLSCKGNSRARGHVVSAEVRKVLSDISKKQVLSDETRKKISDSVKMYHINKR